MFAKKLQLGLKTLLLLMVLVAVGACWIGNQVKIANQEAEAILEIRQHCKSAKIVFDYQADNGGVQSQPSGPAWIRNICGKHVFARVAEVSLEQFDSEAIKAIEKFSRLRELALRDNGDTADLSRLGKLKYLEQLWLVRIDQLKSLVGFEGHPSLRELYVSHCGSFRSCAGISDMPKLENLDISFSTEVVDDGLTGLPALKKIHLRGNLPWTDLRGLGVCQHLESVRLVDFKRLESLRGVQQLPKLEKLNIIFGYSLFDLTHLAGHRELKEIEIHGKATSLKGLSDLPKLTKIELDFSNLESLDGMGELPALEELLLGYSQLNDVDALIEFPSLKILEIESHGLSNLSALKKLNQLNELVLRSCHLTDLDFLSENSSLESLTIDCWELNNVKGLRNVEGLKTLKIQSCEPERGAKIQVAGLSEVIEANPGLLQIRLTHPGMETMKAIGQLKSLSSLRLNYAKDCKDLKFLKASGISKLSLYDCALENLDGLGTNNSLEKVDICCCQSLENIDGISKSRALTHLRIEYCANLKTLGKLADCKTLESFDFTSNSKVEDISAVFRLPLLNSLRLPKKFSAELDRIKQTFPGIYVHF